jgi:hypothetical protein
VNVLSARVTLRDRTLLDVFDLALRFVMAHGGAFAKMSACVSMPLFALSWAAARAWGWGWGWTVAVLLMSLAQAPFVALVSRLVFEDDVPTLGALGSALRALPRLLGARLLALMGIAAGLLFFLLPAVWIASLFFFSTEVIVLEDASVGTAVSRGQHLSSGWFGDVLLAMFLGWLLCLLAILLGETAGRAILEGLLQIRLQTGEDEPGPPLGLFAFWLAVPFLTTARFFVYLNLRTRREGWDIQTRFAAIAARAEREKEEAP